VDAPSASATADEQATEEAAGVPENPADILARNIRAARSACGGCGGELNLDEAAKEKAIAELMKEHSEHGGPPLSRANAELALYGPPGSTPYVAGQHRPAPDVSFRDAAGNEVYRREVKTFVGTPKSFDSAFSKYASKMDYRGELLIQVPRGTDVRVLMEAFWGARKDPRLLAKYANVYAAFRDPDGNPVGVWMFGARGMGVSAL
jgi:hypothetical protein